MNIQMWTSVAIIALVLSDLVSLLIMRQLRSIILSALAEIDMLDEELAFTRNSVTRLEVIVKSLATKKDKK